MHLNYLLFPCEFLEKVEILEIIITLLQMSVKKNHSQHTEKLYFRIWRVKKKFHIFK